MQDAAAFKQTFDQSPAEPALAPCIGVRVAPRSLRIALLGYRSHPHVGGQGIYLHFLSKALVERGHKVDVISGPPYPELDSRVGLIKLPSLDLYAHPHPARALRLHHWRSWADIYEWWSKLSGGFGEPYCFGRRLSAYFRRHRPQYDIVHDNQSLCYGLLDLQAQGVPIMATIHHPITRDRDLALAAAKSRGHAWLIRRWYSFLRMQAVVARRLERVITVSEQSRRDIAAAFGRPLEAIRVIPNGVDTAVFRPMPHIPREPFRLITTASSDQPLKGLAGLLQACAALRTEFPALRLRVIGSLKEGGDTARLLNELGLQDCVDFTAGINTATLVEHYAQASLAVVPSLYEGFGLPAIEAMACGTPLVCSDGGALPEVVGNAARQVRAGNVDDMIDAIRELLSHPQAADALGETGRHHVLQQLSWECVARRLEVYYLDKVREPAC